LEVIISIQLAPNFILEIAEEDEVRFVDNCERADVLLTGEDKRGRKRRESEK
jgi:hypothetical protein